MIDNSEKKRPNANYKLSRENPNPLEEEKLNFYYNRQHRLDKAPDNVKKLYEEPLHKFNLLKPLITGKARSTLFFTIILFCIVIVLLSLMGFMGKTHSLDGNKLEIAATIIDDVTLVILKKNVSGNDPFTGEVNIGVSPVTQGEDFPVFMHKVFFTLLEEERFSFTVPYKSPKLAMVFQTEKSSLKITVNPE